MIYEEKKTGIPATVLILAGVFLVTVSPWALELRSLYWNEGTFAAMVREIASFPPLLTLHGENASGVFPLYPLIVKIIHSCGVGMEFSLRIVPVIALAVLISIVWLCCYRASGRQAAAAGAAVMMSSMIVIDKGLEGNPILLTSLGIFACWLIWFDLGAWRGEWGLAWLASGLVAGLLFYTAGWQGLFMAVVPLLFLRRPLTLRTKPRGPGFVFGVGLILFFILAWGLPRWHAGFAGAFRPDYASPEGTGTYLVQLLVFPFEAAFRLLPWSIFAWAPFCPAIIQLDRNPLLGKYLRTLFVVLFCILWFSPETEGRDIVCLVPPLAVLIGLNLLDCGPPLRGAVSSSVQTGGGCGADLRDSGAAVLAASGGASGEAAADARSGLPEGTVSVSVRDGLLRIVDSAVGAFSCGGAKGDCALETGTSGVYVVYSSLLGCGGALQGGAAHETRHGIGTAQGARGADGRSDGLQIQYACRALSRVPLHGGTDRDGEKRLGTARE